MLIYYFYCVSVVDCYSCSSPFPTK